MPPRKPARKRTRKQPPRSQRVKLLGAVLFVLAFVVASLVLLAQMREHYRSPAPPGVGTAPLLDDVRVELDSALMRAGIGLGDLSVDHEAELLIYQVRGAVLSAEMLAALQQRLERLPGSVWVRSDAARTRIEIGTGAQPLLLLQFLPTLERRKAPPGPRMAIIMDDLGRDLEVARELLDTELAVTFAILPWEPQAFGVARLAHRAQRQVMIHIPMEPQSYPATNPGQGALFVSQSRREIERRMTAFLDRVPYAVGGNNHMGSRFTEDVAGMQTVLTRLKREGLFFVDSRTSGRSVALQQARELGVPATGRDVFLDNVQEVAAIRAEIRRLVDLAARHGRAVGICHPYPETLAALRQERDYLTGRGVQLVPVSELLE